MKNVYVVLGEQGEYSDRSVWVSGVFASKEEAQQSIVERMAKRRDYLNWTSEFNRRRSPRPFGYFKFPLSPAQQVEWDGIEEAALLGMRPKPEYEPAEHTSLFEVPFGAWQAGHLCEIEAETQS
jgi:hypothetical protein